MIILDENLVVRVWLKGWWRMDMRTVVQSSRAGQAARELVRVQESCQKTRKIVFLWVWGCFLAIFEVLYKVEGRARSARQRAEFFGFVLCSLHPSDRSAAYLRGSDRLVARTRMGLSWGNTV